jgi:hypothetical protein
MTLRIKMVRKTLMMMKMKNQRKKLVEKNPQVVAQEHNLQELMENKSVSSSEDIKVENS